MDTNLKNLFVLMSGGDSPSMSAALYGVLKSAPKYNYNKVYLIFEGYRGLVEGGEYMVEATEEYVKSRWGASERLISEGLAVLRCPRYDFNHKELVEAAAARCREYNADLVCIGGDGTLRGAADLNDAGVHANLIPASIDNDLFATQYMCGVFSSLHANIDSIDASQRSDIASNRYTLHQVMGRKCGTQAIMAAMATGSIALVREKTPNWKIEDFEKYLSRVITDMNNKGVKSFSFIISEGIDPISDKKTGDELFIYKLAKMVAKTTGLKISATIHGHEQRAAVPGAADRIVAIRMAQEAVKLLSTDSGNYAIAYKDGIIDHVTTWQARDMVNRGNPGLTRIENRIYDAMCDLFPDEWVIK